MQNPQSLSMGFLSQNSRMAQTPSMNQPQYSYPKSRMAQTASMNQPQYSYPGSCVYINQHHASQNMHNFQKVLVNPHFKAKSKVFVNPNFHGNVPFNGNVPTAAAVHVNPHVQSTLHNLTNNIPLQNVQIHINPNITNVQVPLPQTVHVNPNFKNLMVEKTEAVATKLPSLFEKPSKVVLLTNTKLIRSSITPKKVKRRNSVKSQYKIVRSSPSKTRVSVKSSPKKNSECTNRTRFKIDNTRRKSLTTIRKRQNVYCCKWSTVSSTPKRKSMKCISIVRNSAQLNLVNISGVLYKKSHTSLKKAGSVSTASPKRISTSKQLPAKTQYKFCSPKGQLHSSVIGRRSSKKIVKRFKITRQQSPKKMKVSPKKMKKCNIPCISYRKYGMCKGKSNGKCPLKHDPDQIALCTRFLQGACIKPDCLLSHNVSPEKMPTCKYYLEGVCSRENCPYLHVKISPKAEVCRDFLEGFCKKATECDKRHQYLCPDYEKYGACQKQRCPYPHGKMVRNYVINKQKFAKKCSETKAKDISEPSTSKCTTSSTNQQTNEKVRYYVEKGGETSVATITNENAIADENTDAVKFKNFVGLKSRPKLGSLPSFIAFGES